MLLDGRMLPARLPWHDGNELAEQIAQTVGVEVSELLGIHHVSNRPQDLIQQELQCLLLQVRDENRPSSFVRMILVDLEIYETNEVFAGSFPPVLKVASLDLESSLSFQAFRAGITPPCTPREQPSLAQQYSDSRRTSVLPCIWQMVIS